MKLLTVRRRKKLISLAIFIVIALLAAYLKAHSNMAQKIVVQDQPGSYSINHFIDGDTIAVNMNGQVESVRFIGIDTPETHKPNTPVECYGPEAANYTKLTIGDQRVRLQSDSMSTDRDRYGRLLRYVILPDGTDLNELIVKTGHGFYYPYFPFSQSTAFAADEQQAISQKLGLWGACSPTPSDQGGYKMNELEPASLAK